MARQKQDGPKSLTIGDLARELGVSKATVSNVLRGRRSEVSAATAARVMDKVRETGYVKNLAAAALAGVKTQTLALIAMGVYEPHPGNPDPQITPFYGELVFRLERFARDLGYAVLIYTGWEDDYISFLVQRRVDAAVLVGVAEEHIPSPGQRGNAALIMFDAEAKDPSLMHVRTDDRAGGRLAAEHLLARGCRKLAFLGDFGEYHPNPTTRDRFEGASEACARAGIPLERLQCWHAIRFGEAAAATLHEKGIDGVISAADVIAAGVIKGLQDLGRRVPDDVAVTGYDNLPLAELSQPPLTTLDIDLTAKVRAVLELVEQGSPGDARVVPPRLVVRESA